MPEWWALIVAALAFILSAWQEYQRFRDGREQRRLRDEDVAHRQAANDHLHQARRMLGDSAAHLEDANQIRAEGTRHLQEANQIRREHLEWLKEHHEESRDRDRPRIHLGVGHNTNPVEEDGVRVRSFSLYPVNQGNRSVTLQCLEAEVRTEDGVQWRSIHGASGAGVVVPIGQQRKNAFGVDRNRVQRESPDLLDNPSQVTGRLRVTSVDGGEFPCEEGELIWLLLAHDHPIPRNEGGAIEMKWNDSLPFEMP